MDKPIKVCFVANTGYSLFQPTVAETYGGTQIDMYLIARELQRDARYQVASIFLDYGQPFRRQVNGLELFKSYPPRSRVPRVFQFCRAVGRLWRAFRAADADIYFHQGALFEIAVTRLFCACHGRQLVFRIASSIDVDGSYRKLYPIHGCLYAYGLRGAQAIIAQTTAQQRLLTPDQPPSIVIKNCYPLPPQRVPYGGPTYWIGRLLKIKRAELFLDLAERYPDRKFVMIAPHDRVDGAYADAVAQRADGIRNLVRIANVPFHAIDQHFARAGLLVNTSEYEGFPLTIVQAMSFGIPVLTLGIDPDGTISRWAGRVAASFPELCRHFEELSGRERWERSAASARRYAEEHFGMAPAAAAYKILFERLAASPKNASIRFGFLHNRLFENNFIDP